MKLKFRADPEDFLAFGIFAVFLLYIVAIAVVNLSTFATEGNLSGFNPFPAFTFKYIKTTIAIYLIALLGLFVSVSSYIFEREKGVGFSAEKKDKGYSRWAKQKEIKEELVNVKIQQKNSKAAGIPLIVTEDEMWVDDGEYHSLIIGATGSGKTQGFVFPQVHSLSKARESMIITDPKGEIYEKTSNMLRDRGYQILLLNFRDPQNGSGWNPMSLPYKIYKAGNHDKAIELLDDLALNILYDDSNKNADPFWEKTSADYFSGVALGLFEDAKEDEININSISLATTVGEEKFGGSTYIKEYFAAKDPSSAAAINASSTIMAPTETKASILSVFKQKVKLFASRDNLSEMLSHSDVDLETIGEKPTAVFIVIQDEKKTYHSLVTILLKQIYETLISTAQKHGGKLPVRTNFILDEFANMPPLKDVTTMITAARSRRIRFTMIIQNFAQLDGVYGKEDSETIRGNCGNLIYLITTELKALEEISKMCGEVKSKKDDKTASTPLITVSDLQRMKMYETVILRLRKQPFKTKLTPNFKLNWGKKYPEATYPTRPLREVHTFDIKEFVKNQKKKKLLEMMNAADEEKQVSLKDKDLEERRSYGSRSTSSIRDIPQFSGFNSKKETKKSEGLPRIPSYRDLDREIDIEEERVSSPIKPIVEKKVVTETTTTMPKNDDFDFDVDDLVKKIDAKIAELEKEEKKKKETKTETIVTTEKVDTSFNDIKPLATDKVVETTTTTTVVRPSIDLNDQDDDDDDDFFDDFFDN